MKPGKKLFVASLLVAAAAVQSACSANISATETADASTPVETASPQRPSDKSTDDADTTAEDSSREAESVIPPLGSFRSEEHTSELQSRFDIVCRLLLEKKQGIYTT